MAEIPRDTWSVRQAVLPQIHARLALAQEACLLDDAEEHGMVARGVLCCDLEGFSLHAKVAIAAHDRAGLERLCRTIARPAIASDRLSIDPDGRVVYRLRRHGRDGTSAIVFEPLAFLERLAASSADRGAFRPPGAG